MWHDSFMHVTWLLHACDMTHSYVWHDSLLQARLTHKRDKSHSICHMTRSYMWYDSIICVTYELYHRHDSLPNMTCLTPYVTWRIHTCDMTDFICVTWLITAGTTTETCDMTHSRCDVTPSYMWHHSIICVTWLITAGTTRPSSTFVHGYLVGRLPSL